MAARVFFSKQGEVPEALNNPTGIILGPGAREQAEGSVD